MIAGIPRCVAKLKLERDAANLKKKKFVALVGAGFSCNAAAEFPLWNEISDWVGGVFKDKLKGKLPRSVLGDEADDFTVAAEWYYYMLGMNPALKTSDMSFGKKSFISSVKTELDTASHGASLEAHQALLGKFDVIYTTNWDCLLENALDDGKLPYMKYLLREATSNAYGIWKGNKGTITGRAAKKIIKYHGCCADADGWSIVASRTDYDKRLLRFSETQFRSATTANDFDKQLSDSFPVLVGYSYKDINIRFVFSQVHMTTPKLRALNIVVDNPAHFSKDRLKFFEDVYGIETLFLFPETDEYHKLRGRWESALRHKDRGGNEDRLTKYKKEMTKYSRERFAEFFTLI